MEVRLFDESGQKKYYCEKDLKKIIYLITSDVNKIEITLMSEYSCSFSLYFNLIPKKSHSISNAHFVKIKKKVSEKFEKTDVVQYIKNKFFSNSEYVSYDIFKKIFYQKYRINRVRHNYLYNKPNFLQTKNSFVKKNVEEIKKNTDKKNSYYKMKFNIYLYLKKIAEVLWANKLKKNSFSENWLKFILFVNKLKLVNKLIKKKLKQKKEEKEIRKKYFSLWKKSKKTCLRIFQQKLKNSRLYFHKSVFLKILIKKEFLKNNSKNLLKKTFFKFYTLQKLNIKIRIFSFQSILKSDNF